MSLPPILSTFDHPLSLSEYINQPLTIGERELFFAADHDHVECLLDQEVVGRFHRRLTHFHLKPALLDRPLFLALKTPVTLSPGERRSFLLDRPISLELNLSHTGNAEHFRLLTFPCVLLKRTSYGTVDQAMVCYYWESQECEEARSPYFALVPVEVVNQATSTVQLKKLVIYKNYMKLYATSRQLCTSAIKVKLSNRREGFISYQSAPPDLLSGEDFTTIEPEPDSRFHLINSFRNFKRRGTGIEHGF